MTEKTAQQSVWYLRREGRQVGPFASAKIRRLLLEGQVNLDDEVSRDRQSWQKVGQVAEVVPPQLRGGGNASASADRAKVARAVPWLGISTFVLVVGAILAFAVWWGASPVRGEVDCAAPALAGVDLSNCKLPGYRAPGADLRGARLAGTDFSGAALAGSDLSAAVLDYADLSRADLAYGVFEKARLRGADLRGADLSQADFSNADLSFADLSDARIGAARFDGARLDNAIWFDRRQCAPGSVGNCD